jgi:hypothetical protein
MREALQVRKLDEPFARQRAAVVRDSVFASLKSLAVGEALEFNRPPTSMRWYTMKFRKEFPEMRFAIKAGQSRWSKVWRLK